MRTISIRDLHEKTGAWVRKSKQFGEIRVTDHGRVVARILPGEDLPAKPTFANWQPLPEYAGALDQEILGMDAGSAISDDRSGT